MSQLKVEDRVYREETEKGKGEGGRVYIREIEGFSKHLPWFPLGTYFLPLSNYYVGFPGGLAVKNPPAM